MSHWLCEPKRYKKKGSGDWIPAPTWTKDGEYFHRSLQAIIGADRWSSTSYNIPRQCDPGDTVWLSPGEHPFFRLTHSYDETGIDKSIVIRGIDKNNRPVFYGNPVGGSETCYAEWAGGWTLKDIVLGSDDTSIFKTENPSSIRWKGTHPGSRDLYFDNVDMRGTYNHRTAEGPHGKWGALVYQLGISAGSGPGLVWKNSRWGGIYKEHAWYEHNSQGDHLFENIKVRGCGRTAWQFANRRGEGPDGRGDLTFRRCVVKDVCLQPGGGGSAWTIKGNHDGKVLLEECVGQLGCDSRLHPQFQDSITGCLVTEKYDDGGEEDWLRELEIDSCHFEVGEFFQGKGSARRPNLNLGYIGTLSMHNTKVINHPGTREAMNIDTRNIGRIFMDDSNEVRGDVILNGEKFADPQRTGAGYAQFLETLNLS